MASSSDSSTDSTDSSSTLSLSGMSHQKQGLIYAILAYTIWGLFPLYWRPVMEVNVWQIVAHRVIWSAVFLAMLLAWRGEWGQVFGAFKNKKTILVFSVSSILLSSNWLIYIWAVTHGHIVDASLGYFINPLFNVFLGWVVFKERLSIVQYLALTLAAIGVLWLTYLSGSFPWVAISLALTFGFYGLLRKVAPLGALSGLALETFLLLPFAIIFLMFVAWEGALEFRDLSTLAIVILMGSGVATSVPLLMFAAGARRVSLATMGMIQYISPTLLFLSGLYIFHEAFNPTRFVGFLWVWAGVLLYLVSSVLRYRQRAADKIIH